jgi:hypothetical protein
MGSGVSVPEVLDLAAAKELAGERFDEDKFNGLATDGKISRQQFDDEVAAMTLATSESAPAVLAEVGANEQTADARKLTVNHPPSASTEECTMEIDDPVNGPREYRFTVPEQTGDRCPLLVIVVGGMGQGKTTAQESVPSFKEGLHEHHIELGMDALKAACVTFQSDMAEISASKEGQEQDDAINALKSKYQKLMKPDQGKIVKQLMQWRVDVVCEFANEDNLYDMAVGISHLFPSLQSMSELQYKLRLMAVQCMDTPENIVVATNSRTAHLGQMGLAMQKWIVSKGCLVRGAFFLDSMQHIFQAEAREGFSLVEMAFMMTRAKCDSGECSLAQITSEDLLASKFVTEAGGRLSPATTFKKGHQDKEFPAPYANDAIPSTEWQWACAELEKDTLFDPFNKTNPDNHQVEFTEELRAKWEAYCATNEVKRLLAHEAAAQEYILEKTVKEEAANVEVPESSASASATDRFFVPSQRTYAKLLLRPNGTFAYVINCKASVDRLTDGDVPNDMRVRGTYIENGNTCTLKPVPLAAFRAEHPEITIYVDSEDEGGGDEDSSELRPFDVTLSDQPFREGRAELAMELPEEATDEWMNPDYEE